MTSLTAHGASISIGAGGIVPLGAKLPEDQRTSPVTARAYAHPALDGKVIVRLEPDAVAAGTDAEMAAFGFAEPKVSKSLGLVRYRTLGFPAWALIHDPKKAKAALDVTDDLRKAKRLVAAKPGHAKEAFEKIAKQLQRTAPQFLPSFWEEAGRVVADQASSSMAAQCFERARQAERAYKLKTNPDDSDAVFVEFALLGALSAKTLSAYAKELAKSAGGKEAYRRYRAIIVKRALGGMPPYSGMGKDLRSLAHAAGANVEAEDDALVTELIDAPGVGKAPVEFWTTYRDVLVRLAKARPEVRARLRAIWPVPRGGSDDTRKAFKATWIELLSEIGALHDLPDDGLGAWISRLVKFAGSTPRVEETLRAVAPRLAKLDQPIAVLVEDGWSEDLHLDLAELALSLGVRLADPRDQDDFSTAWMTCDPVRVAADDRYGKKLVALLARYMGDKDHEHKMAGKQGFVAARRQWIEEHVAKLADAPLIGCSAALDMLEEKTTAETFLPFQDLLERLSRVDLAQSLAHQLRSGSVDELGWPAYEEAFARLGGEIQIGGAFPILCAWNQSKVIAVGKDGVIAEHDLVYKPADHAVDGVIYVDGQFLVVLDPEKGWQNVAYWSGTPKQRFDLATNVTGWGGDSSTAWTTPAGAVSLGGKAFRAGETPQSGSQQFVATKTEMWQPEGKSFKSFDPDAGKKGAGGTPPFVGEWEPRPGWTLQAEQCVLVPAPDGLASSPLGMRDGLLGLRIRQRDQPDPDDWSDQPNEVERIDGVKWTGTVTPFALLLLPGDDVPRPLTTSQANSKRFPSGNGPGTSIWSPNGELSSNVNDDIWGARGWGLAHVPAAAFWDYLTPRDPAGSQALRAISIDAARAILDAARVEVAAGGELGKRELKLTEAAVRAIRPAVTDDKLVRGIAGIAEYAAELANRLVTIAAERSKEHADPSGQTLAGDAAQLRKLAAALAAGRAAKLPDFDLDLSRWLQHGLAAAALAISPLATDDERRKARDLVRALAGTVLADDLSRMRILEIQEPDDYDDDADWNTLVIRTQDNSVFAIHTSNNWALELSLDGTFRVPAPFSISKETRLSHGVGTEWANAFLALPDEKLAWDPAIAQAIAERADLSIAEATLLYTGAPDRDGYGKDFLGKQRREMVGLKLGDADAARTTFRDMDDVKLYGLIAAAVPDDPRLLVQPLAPGGFAERLADAWKRKFGKRAKVPQDLIALAKKETELDDELGPILAALAGDDDAWFLKPDLRSYPELGGWGDGHGLNAQKSRELATFIGWLFLQRPVGCAIRAGIPRVIEKLRAVLDDPRVLWKFDDLYVGDDSAKGKARRQQLVDLVGGKPFDVPADADDPVKASRDDGACVVVLYENSATAAFRPAKLAGRSAQKIEQLANIMVDEEESWGDPPIADVAIAQLLKGEGFAALGARVAKTEVPEGQYEANPLHSAKKLVAKVAKDLSVSEDAAALYLQTLALAEPTQAKITLWNGWKPKQYQTAASELAKKKLVTEGKRERAGRSIFLKGGYSKGDKKNLPMEEWKQPFYAVLSRHVITEPAHALFARAYKRIEDGDKP